MFLHFSRVPRRLANVDKSLVNAVRPLVQGKEPWPLFLHGPAGVGKTYAALCMLDHLDRERLGQGDWIGGEYYLFASLCSDLIAANLGTLTWSHEGRGGDTTPTMIWKWVRTRGLAVLDEVGARVKASDFQNETIQRWLDERQGQPAIVISNVGPDGMRRAYDDPICSRMFAGTTIDLAGIDRRLGV